MTLLILTAVAVAELLCSLERIKQRLGVKYSQESQTHCLVRSVQIVAEQEHDHQNGGKDDLDTMLEDPGEG